MQCIKKAADVPTYIVIAFFCRRRTEPREDLLSVRIIAFAQTGGGRSYARFFVA